MRRKLRELNYDIHSEIKRKSKTIKIRNTNSIKLIPKIILDDAREKVKNNVQVYKKTNWVFAIVIIIICLILLYFLYKKLNHFWK